MPHLLWTESKQKLKAIAAALFCGIPSQNAAVQWSCSTPTPISTGIGDYVWVQLRVQDMGRYLGLIKCLGHLSLTITALLGSVGPAIYRIWQNLTESDCISEGMEK